MRVHKQPTATMILAAASLTAMWGMAACTGGNDTVTGMRLDGVKVACTAQSDGVSTCSPDDGDAPCDSAATVLWPPNHKLIRFTLADCAPIQDGCGGGGDGGILLLGGPGGINRTGGGARAAGSPVDLTGFQITSITSDEPVEVGAGGDGHTTDYDMAIIDPVTFDLRSERQGGGDGRVYRISYLDPAGVAATCEFMVPHDQGPTSGAIDSGTAATVAPPPAMP